MNKRMHLALHAVGIAVVLTLGLAATAAAEARPRVRVGVWVGGPLWWGGWPYPYGYSYGYPYVVERPVLVQAPAEPLVVAPAQQSHSWYYCHEAQMYYPYVTSCPSGWQEVPATPAPTSAPEAAAAAPSTTPGNRIGTPVPATRSK